MPSLPSNFTQVFFRCLVKQEIDSVGLSPSDLGSGALSPLRAGGSSQLQTRAALFHVTLRSNGRNPVALLVEGVVKQGRCMEDSTHPLYN